MREKLIELLRKVQYQGNAVHGYHDKYIQNGELADHLIANGVVVSKMETTTRWIPVTERLPQEDEPLGATCEHVQVLLADGTVTTGWCNRFRKLWYHLPWGDTHFYAYPYEHTPVIAWQPLAEPPKGE